jgi:4-hydroxybenzoate polyprenyltransferase
MIPPLPRELPPARTGRLVVLLARPAVICLLAIFAGIGLALGGRAGDLPLTARVLAAIAGFLLFSVACNDLADELIDRVNLPGRRPLGAGLVTRSQFGLIGGTAAVTAPVCGVVLVRPG